MDRFSSWHGATTRPRRVPPRVPQRRRSAPRAAAWDGARRWWFAALSALALALLIPAVMHGQGLRSQPAVITLRVTAPPELRAKSAALRRGPSVADVVVSLPSPGWDVGAAELRLEEQATPVVRLFVRAADGRLTPLDAEWTVVRAESPVGIRVIAPAGSVLPSGSWRVRYRLSSRDGSAPAIEGVNEVALPELR